MKYLDHLLTNDVKSDNFKVLIKERSVGNEKSDLR